MPTTSYHLHPITYKGNDNIPSAKENPWTHQQQKEKHIQNIWRNTMQIKFNHKCRNWQTLNTEGKLNPFRATPGFWIQNQHACNALWHSALQVNTLCKYWINTSCTIVYNGDPTELAHTRQALWGPQQGSSDHSRLLLRKLNCYYQL